MSNALQAIPAAEGHSALDAELQRLIAIHGPVAVRKAATRLGKGKKGRKPEQDWRQLASSSFQDAKDWLDGKDPMDLRSNYAIANDFVARHPGQSAASTHRRIMGKLASGRERHFLYFAWHFSESERPFSDYFRAAETLAELDPEMAQGFQILVDLNRGKLERYRKWFGEPAPDMTMAAIAREVDSPMNALMAPSPARRGILAQAVPKPPA